MNSMSDEEMSDEEMSNEEMADMIEILERPSPETVVVACARCAGSGSLGGTPEDPLCPTCRGGGRLTLEVGDEQLRRCTRCRGTGRLGGAAVDPVCAKCFGAGCVTDDGTPGGRLIRG